MPNTVLRPSDPPCPDLALVVIARNEARCIERCLSSAKSYVARLVVLDTGSTDATIALAEAAGATVFQAAWPNDFAAARNLALQLADAEWSLVLDADEWIASGGEHLRAATLAGPCLGAVQVRSDFEVAGQRGVDNTWITRLLPRGARYAGRIHEQVVGDFPKNRLAVVVGHDGYQPAQLASKRGRNRSLLLEELASRAGDPYLLYQLGKECELSGEMQAAADYYLQARALGAASVAYAHDLTLRLLYCLSQSGRLEQAIDLASEVMADWPESPDYFFVLGNLCLDYATLHPKQAASEWLPMAENAWLRCLEIGERPELDGSVSGRGSFLAAHNLALIYNFAGDAAKERYYRELASQKPRS